MQSTKEAYAYHCHRAEEELDKAAAATTSLPRAAHEELARLHLRQAAAVNPSFFNEVMCRID